MIARPLAAALVATVAWSCAGHAPLTASDASAPVGPDAMTDGAADAAVDAADSATDGAAGASDAAADQAEELAPLMCGATSVGGSSGGTTMLRTWTEACNDGTHYSADCWCPEGICCCYGPEGGPASCGYQGTPVGDGVVPFDCDGGLGNQLDGGGAALAACGFPH